MRKVQTLPIFARILLQDSSLTPSQRNDRILIRHEANLFTSIYTYRAVSITLALSRFPLLHHYLIFDEILRLLLQVEVPEVRSILE